MDILTPKVNILLVQPSVLFLVFWTKTSIFKNERGNSKEWNVKVVFSLIILMTQKHLGQWDLLDHRPRSLGLWPRVLLCHRPSWASWLLHKLLDLPFEAPLRSTSDANHASCHSPNLDAEWDQVHSLRRGMIRDHQCLSSQISITGRLPIHLNSQKFSYSKLVLKRGALYLYRRTFAIKLASIGKHVVQTYWLGCGRKYTRRYSSLHFSFFYWNDLQRVWIQELLFYYKTSNH